MSSKTLVKDEIGTLLRERDNLISKIDDTLARMQVSFEQWKRHYYFELGELFTRLRKMLPKGHKGDVDFSALCKKHWPKIKTRSRQDYMMYFRRLGSSRIAMRDLPPLQKLADPPTYKRNQNLNTERLSYKRILDEEYRDPAHFEIERSKKEIEHDLIIELAEKIVSTGYRTLSIKMHPDKKGGTNEAQRRLNAAKDMLDEALVRQPLLMA